jgi:hypothetical protein
VSIISEFAKRYPLPPQVFDSDDFGCNHIISDMCQSHDCRDVLDELHRANPAFKATLFAIPYEMTQELLEWCELNQAWVQIAMHGFKHTSNYECVDITYQEFDDLMKPIEEMVELYFVKGFKAPGWQISDEAYEWLLKNDWWVADQDYNDDRRPKELPVYKVGPNSVHTHTWNCMGNGVYELREQLIEKASTYPEWKFITEVIDG